jgi:hypothetical protein
MIIQGYDVSSYPLGQPRDKITLRIDGWTVKSTLLCLYANWLTLVSTGIQTPHPIYATCLLSEVDVVQEEEMGELCLVTLTYDQRYSNIPTTPTPPSQFGVNAGRVIQDITLHPSFPPLSAAAPTTPGPYAFDASAPWSQFWDSTKKDWQSDATGKYLPAVPAYLIGWTKFPDASATIWTKIYYRSLPIDPLPDNTITDPGFGFGPSGCYVVSSCDEQKENAFWCRTTHFDYYPNGAPTHIFRTA